MIHYFVMAGGYGTRAKPLANEKPKPLFPLNGQPLLHLILRQLFKKGVKEGFINVHYKPEQFEHLRESEFNPQLLYEKELTGNMILKESLDVIDDWLLVINGDIFLDIPVVKMLEKVKDSDADGVLLLRKSNGNQYPAIDVAEDRFLGRKKWQHPHELMYAGVALLHKRVIQMIDQFNIVDVLIEHKCAIKVVIYQDIWLDFGDPLSYFEGNFAYLNYSGVKSENSISENVVIAAEAQVKNSIIWENTKISGASVISDCIITDNLDLANVHYHKKIVSKDHIYNLS